MFFPIFADNSVFFTKLFSRAANATESARALQAAEKLNRAVGRGFIPGKKPTESAWASAPEACFWGFSIDRRPFSATSLAPEGMSAT
jgi:hypothetical protein